MKKNPLLHFLLNSSPTQHSSMIWWPWRVWAALLWSFSANLTGYFLITACVTPESRAAVVPLGMTNHQLRISSAGFMTQETGPDLPNYSSASDTTILNAITSILCLLVCSIPHALMVSCGKAHIDDEDATVATMLELFRTIFQLPRNLAASVLIHNRGMSLALLRRWLDMTNKMANARTQGYTVTSDIFQVELISNNHPYWCWVSSLSTGTVVYSSCMDTTNHNSLLLFPRGWDQQLSNQCASTNSSSGIYCLWHRGYPFVCPGSSLNSTDDKF